MPATAKRTKKRNKKRQGPESRELHKLYELSVQAPEGDIEFFDRVFSK